MQTITRMPEVQCYLIMKGAAWSQSTWSTVTAPTGEHAVIVRHGDVAEQANFEKDTPVWSASG